MYRVHLDPATPPGPCHPTLFPTDPDNRVSRLKRSAVRCYYYASLPYRWWASANRTSAGRAPVMVLFYHRVAAGQPNAWTTTPRAFAGQIAWLRRHFDLVSLGTAQDRIRSQCNPRPCVSVTFDDGYAENCRLALPLLIAQRIPCTYFVATRHVLQGSPFPHDVAAGRPLAPNTIDQIRRLADAGVEIGAHTRTHADLGAIGDRQRLVDEMAGGKAELETELDREIRYFAFPYGQPCNLSVEAFQVARAAGFHGVCSAYGGYNFPGADPFHLRRIHADADSILLKNWLTVDPRKRRLVNRLERGLPWIRTAGAAGVAVL